MAVKLQFINLIVRIDKIKEKYPGGWEQCLIDHEDVIGKRVWYDEYLFRDGAMNPLDMEDLLDHWTRLGFVGAVGKKGEMVWGDDMCVAEGLMGGPTRTCTWLEMQIDPHVIYVYFKGTKPGEIIGRDNVKVNQEAPVNAEISNKSIPSNKMTLSKFLIGFWPIMAWVLSIGALQQLVTYQNIPNLVAVFIYIVFSIWALYSVNNYK